LREKLSGTQWLMASLLYGTGMRLMECVRLRIQDADFDYRQIVVRNAKGAKDRMVPLREALHAALREHLGKVHALFEEDRRLGVADVYLPNALATKYPNAPKEWVWQYVFPSGRLSVDPRSGKTRGITCTRTGSRRPSSRPRWRPGSPSASTERAGARLL
jgi:integrase